MTYQTETNHRLRSQGAIALRTYAPPRLLIRPNIELKLLPLATMLVALAGLTWGATQLLRVVWQNLQ